MQQPRSLLRRLSRNAIVAFLVAFVALTLLGALGAAQEATGRGPVAPTYRGAPPATADNAQPGLLPRREPAATAGAPTGAAATATAGAPTAAGATASAGAPTAGAPTAGAPTAAVSAAAPTAAATAAATSTPPSASASAAAAAPPRPTEAASTASAATGAAPATPAEDRSFFPRFMSFVGIFVFLGLGALMSNNRKAIDWRLVGMGTGIQLVFAVLILKTEPGERVFEALGDVFKKLLEFTGDGSKMIFSSFIDGKVDGALINFAFAVLPTIIFFSAFMSVMYHVGVMQFVVNALAKVMQYTMRTSGPETLSAAGNIFVGQTEAPLLVKPFIAKMTNSELMAVMTGGFATIAGGVMAAYIGMLSPHLPGIAAHLLAASVMSAPAALVFAKLMYPETERDLTQPEAKLSNEKIDANLVDAAARGASEGMSLALNVAAMLIAFVALIAMVNYVMGYLSYVQHGYVLSDLLAWLHNAGHTLPQAVASKCDLTTLVDGAPLEVKPQDRLGCIRDVYGAIQGAAPVHNGPIGTFFRFEPEAGTAFTAVGVFNLEFFFGVLGAPFAFFMGVPAQDCFAIGQLLGQKTVLNEFVAYLNLANMMNAPDSTITARSGIIASYALCGFANFGSIGIQLGGIGSLAPERRGDLAKIGMRAMIAGTLASFLTANIAGLLL